MSAFIPSQEQARVIGAPVDADVLVVAGAGSGKTFTMTQRIIALIERGVAPERILGLTFTRKAAGELLDRVSAAVAKDAGAGNDERMFLKPAVHTYDAFFQTIVRQYGLLVGFDQNTQPLSEAGATQLAIDVIGEHMDLLTGHDLGTFRTIAGKVLALSNAICSAMIGAGCADISQAIARVREWDHVFAAQVRCALESERAPEALWTPTKRPKRTKKDDDASYAAKVQEWLERFHGNCVFRCAQLVETAETRDVLLDLVEAYAAEKRRLNMAEFSDFTIAAYQLVTRFPSIGMRYRRRFSHVLLDEYQDTSTTQAALLAALFHAPENTGEHEAKNELEQTDGTAVSAVGDPFQSIYAWRGASPGAFRMFQHDFGLPEQAKPLTLSMTRRNSRLVLEAANDLTQPLRLAPRRPGSSPMREVDVPQLRALPDAAVGTIGVLGYETLGQEIDGVTRFCREAVERCATVDGQGRRRRGSVAVLFRSKKTMVAYQEALEQAGLSTFVVGYSALLERPEVRDVLALLHVAADHTDGASLMRLLATPRFGLSNADLSCLSAMAEAANVEARFHALVEAGLADAETPRAQWAGLVREHRDHVSNIVFLADVVMSLVEDSTDQDDKASRDDSDRRDDEDSQDGRSEQNPRDGQNSRGGQGNREDQNDRSNRGNASLDKLTAEGQTAVQRAGRMLREVCDAVGRPLADVVRAAVRALDLDIDAVVAQSLRADGQTVNPTVARMPMDAIIDLVDTYTAEIAVDRSPSLRGFMAWVDALSSLEDEAAAMYDERADVELMTIHQSKGLEWDAVAVVGMREGAFPSNTGDGLKIAVDERHVGGVEDGRWTSPEYHETARTWLSDPTAVPVPVRADAGILPRFPHDAPVGGDPLDSLRSLEDIEAIDDEVFGSMREVGDGVEEVDPDGWYLTQEEEYGRRLHADERRLAYVALTRARHDVLLTYSAYNEPSRDPAAVASGAKSANPSNFWLEVHDALCGRPGVANEPSDASTETQPALPRGFFVGENARAYLDSVVGAAWRTPIPPSGENGTLPWPIGLSESVAMRLSDSAQAVRQAMWRMETSDTISRAAARPRTLLECARLLVDDPDLMDGSLTGKDLDRAVKAMALRVLAQGRRTVTSLQTGIGGMSEREERAHWRGIVRPIPSVASPAAAAGTILHNWAERFVNAVNCETSLIDAEDCARAGNLDGPSLTGGGGLSRASMIADLERREAAWNSGRDESSNDMRVQHELMVWQRRLVDSPWAKRIPAWAERQIVLSIPELDGAIVNGKLDAVFLGGIDQADKTKRFTVVDWKTGRKPTDARDVREKLVQLDLYRLLLSAVEGVPLKAIDATLYYLSEPDEAARWLRAEPKDDARILAELREGIPAMDDE